MLRFTSEETSMPTDAETSAGLSLVRAAEAETLVGDPGAIALLLDSSHTDGR